MKRLFYLFMGSYIVCFLAIIIIKLFIFSELHFYESLAILNGVLIPFAVLYISQYLQERETNRRSVIRLENLFSKFNSLHTYLQSLFASLQYIPEDKDEQQDCYNERYKEFIEYYNDLLDEYGKSKLYFYNKNGQKLLDLVEEYLKSTRLNILNWRRVHLDSERRGIDTKLSREYYHKYYEGTKEFLKEENLEKIQQEFIKVKENL